MNASHVLLDEDEDDDDDTAAALMRRSLENDCVGVKPLSEEDVRPFCMLHNIAEEICQARLFTVASRLLVAKAHDDLSMSSDEVAYTLVFATRVEQMLDTVRHSLHLIKEAASRHVLSHMIQADTHSIGIGPVSLSLSPPKKQVVDVTDEQISNMASQDPLLMPARVAEAIVDHPTRRVYRAVPADLIHAVLQQDTDAHRKLSAFVEALTIHKKPITTDVIYDACSKNIEDPAQAHATATRISQSRMLHLPPPSIHVELKDVPPETALDLVTGHGSADPHQPQRIARGSDDCKLARRLTAQTRLPPVPRFPLITIATDSDPLTDSAPPPPPTTTNKSTANGAPCTSVLNQKAQRKKEMRPPPRKTIVRPPSSKSSVPAKRRQMEQTNKPPPWRPTKLTRAVLDPDTQNQSGDEVVDLTFLEGDENELFEFT